MLFRIFIYLTEKFFVFTLFSPGELNILFSLSHQKRNKTIYFSYAHCTQNSFSCCISFWDIYINFIVFSISLSRERTHNTLCVAFWIERVYKPRVNVVWDTPVVEHKFRKSKFRKSENKFFFFFFRLISVENFGFTF